MLVGLLSAAIEVPPSRCIRMHNCPFKANARETPEYKSKDLQRRICTQAGGISEGVSATMSVVGTCGYIAPDECGLSDIACARSI